MDPRSSSGTLARVTALSLLALCGTAVLGPEASASTTAAAAADDQVGPQHVALAEAANAKITRLAGDANAPTVVRDERRVWMYRAGRQFTESPLPDGYPRPTAPGVTELKHFPSVRRAEFGGEGNSGDRGFWPLFRHISSRDIAMTAPVEMDVTDDGTTMSFLYQTRELGPVGDAEMGVVVRDTDPVWVISMGFAGRRTGSRVMAATAELERMAAELEGWTSTGNTRWMGYNSPSVPRDRQWWEMQLIVERTKTPDAIDTADADPAVAETGEGDAES